MSLHSGIRWAIGIGLAVMMCLPNPVLAQTAAEQLDKAIELFEQGKLQASEETLKKIDAAALTDEKRQQLNDFSTQLKVAVGLSQKADKDFASAEELFKAGKKEEAVRSYRSVTENGFAPAALVEASRKRLAEIDKPSAPAKSDKPAASVATPQVVQAAPPAASAPAASVQAAAAQPKPAQPQTPPAVVVAQPPKEKQQPSSAPARPTKPATEAEAKAADLVKRGQQAIQNSQYDEAVGLFDQALALVPGLPEAVQGKETALQHRTVEEEPQNLSLVEKLRWRDNVRWQRAVSTYRKIDEQIRESVIRGNFDEAKRQMQVARQVIESNRRYADPVEKYENLKSESEALASFVADEERRWNEEEIRRRRDEAQRIQEERRATVQQQRQEKIQTLMDQVYQLRKERDFEGAIEVLKQVRALDPNNDNARWLLESLEDVRSLREQVATEDNKDREQVDISLEMEKAKIPWHKDVLFPSNWLEITAKRAPFVTAGDASESPANRKLHEKLQQTIPELNFEETPFESVIELLGQQNEVNVHVNWNALEANGLDRQTEVSVKLQDVRLEKALELVLDDVGGSDVKLGYVMDEGVLRISTQEDLDTKTTTEVYDIRDLIVQIPSNYNAPQMDLTQITQATQQGGGGGGQSIFRDEQRQDQQELETKADELVTSILDLIRSTISPDSWREAGGVIGSIQEMNGLLVVTQTAAAHKAMRDLLTKLRGPRAIQIAVEARFLTVQTNFLEAIGTDLDVILNQGNAGYDYFAGDSTGSPVVDPTTGGRILVPRDYTRLGVLPAVTSAGGIPMAATDTAETFIQQPYGQVGLVPGHGQVGPHSSQWTPIPLLNNSIDIADPSNATTNVPGTFGEGNLLTPAFQTFGTFLDNIQVDFLVRATQAHQRSTLVTAPRVVLFNGQRSFVAVTQTQAYISDLDPVIGDRAAIPDPQISSVSSGTVLVVEATVSADRRYVTLTLEPQIARILQIADFPVISSSFTTGGGIVQLPEVQVTQIRTSVSVPDGGTVLLGGQKLTGEVEIEAGVPILSKIPGLKRAFSNKSLVKDEQILLILVQPKIIIQEEAEEEAFPTLAQEEKG